METNQIDFVGRAGCTGNALGLRLLLLNRLSYICLIPRGYLSHSCWLKASFTSDEGFSEYVKREPLMIQPHASHPHADNVPSSSHTSSLAIQRSLPPALYALGISLILHSVRMSLLTAARFSRGSLHIDHHPMSCSWMSPKCVQPSIGPSALNANRRERWELRPYT